MQLTCIEGGGNEYLFQYRPKNLDSYTILNELLGFGPIKAIDLLVDFDQWPLGIASIEFKNEPNIPIVAKFIRTYTKPKQTPTGSLLSTNNVPQGPATTAHENPGPSQTPNLTAAQSCEGTANFGEEELRLDPFEKTRIFFVVSPQDSDERVYHDFREYGLLDYIFIAKEQKGNRRFRYARYESPLAARMILHHGKLGKYRCRPGRKPSTMAEIRADPNFREKITCLGCAMTIEAKFQSEHNKICERQIANPPDPLKFIRKHRCGEWVLKIEYCEHYQNCPISRGEADDEVW